MKDKENIKDLSIEELSRVLESIGEPSHRTSQLLHWLYRKGIDEFEKMRNIPKSLRSSLSQRFSISSLEEVEVLHSLTDGSSKHLLRCGDGEIIETVLMHSAGHRTICISTQVGCPLGCRFCRTGKGGLVRNLKASEIVDQVLYFKKHYLEERKRFNIVMMGMGEPFLNKQNLYRALEVLNHPDSLSLGEKRITVSTIGFPEEIKEITTTGLKFSLAISLNATDDSTRKYLMPGASEIGTILEAAEYFAKVRKTRVTLEYILIKDINDTPDDAERLSNLTKGKPFKINLIPFNEWEGSEFKRPDEDRINAFISRLLPRAPAVTVRRSMGQDIQAACGQLRAKRAGSI